MQDHLVAEPIRLTYHDFCALPDDGKRYEILDGELYMRPSPRMIHQQAVFRLGRILADHVDEHRLGEVFIAPFDVVLGDNDIVEPNLIFVSNARKAIVTEDNIQGVPDLLIEVLSPTRPELDTRDKRAVYARCGVPFYWIVDPKNQRLTELQLVGKAYAVAAERTGQDLFAPRLLPGLSFSLEMLWA